MQEIQELESKHDRIAQMLSQAKAQFDKSGETITDVQESLTVIEETK